jgi:hypothetical protein
MTLMLRSSWQLVLEFGQVMHPTVIWQRLRSYQVKVGHGWQRIELRREATAEVPEVSYFFAKSLY